MNRFKKVVLSAAICVVAVGASQGSLAQGISASYIKGETIEETSNITDGYLFDTVENLYLVSGDDFADALTGGVYIGETNGSLFYVNNKKINELGYKRISRAKNVYLIGGENAIPESLVKNLKNYRGRIAGINRYETGIKVAKKMGTHRNILIASGENYPDALSASALAVEKDMNIILTGKDKIADSVKEYLRENKNREIYFVGGEAAVSNKVKREIYSIAEKPESLLSKRIIAGKNRYETSKAVAEAFGPSEAAILANGNQYKDALLGTNLAAKEQAPLLLVSAPSQVEDASKVLGNRNTSKLFAISTGDHFKIQTLNQLVSKLSGGTVPIKNAKGDILKVPAEVKAPEAKAVEKPVAPKENTGKASNGKTFTFKKSFTVTATAYTHDGSRTKSGKWPKVGMIAVDPKVIPLGTYLYVEGYGFATAEDTGGAIKGNKIDIFLNSERECRNWGRRSTTVYIIK